MHEGAEGAIQEGVARPAALDGARQRQVSATATPVSAGILSAGGVHSMHVTAHRTQTPTLVPPSRLGDSLSRSLQDSDPTRRRSNQEGVTSKSMTQETVTLVWDRMVLALMKQMVVIREVAEQEGVVCDLVMAWEQAATLREMVIDKVELNKESGNSDTSSTQVATSTTVTISLVSPTTPALAASLQWAFFDSVASGAAFVQCGGSDASPVDSKAHLALALVTKPNSRAGFAQACTYKGATRSSAVTQQSKRNPDAGVPESLRYASQFCGPKTPVRNYDGHSSARIYLTGPSTSSYAVAPDEKDTGQHSTANSRRIGLPSNDAARGYRFGNQIQTRELKSPGSSALWDVGMCSELEVELLGQEPTDFGSWLREHVAGSKCGADCVCENGHRTSEDLTTTTHCNCAEIDSQPHTDDPVLTGQLDHARHYRSISHQWTLLVCNWVSPVKQVLLAVMHKVLGTGEGLDTEHAGDERNSSRRPVTHPHCAGHCSSPVTLIRAAISDDARPSVHHTAFGHSVPWGLGVIRI
ncbi:hypothetical protein CF326_g8917 [Tilletia indica]|nr:hypothetical protein CF326_g8917 [Tilletia indica]